MAIWKFWRQLWKFWGYVVSGGVKVKFSGSTTPTLNFRRCISVLVVLRRRFYVLFDEMLFGGRFYVDDNRVMVHHTGTYFNVFIICMNCTINNTTIVRSVLLYHVWIKECGSLNSWKYWDYAKWCEHFNRSTIRSDNFYRAKCKRQSTARPCARWLASVIGDDDCHNLVERHSDHGGNRFLYSSA